MLARPHHVGVLPSGVARRPDGHQLYVARVEADIGDVVRGGRRLAVQEGGVHEDARGVPSGEQGGGGPGELAGLHGEVRGLLQVAGVLHLDLAGLRHSRGPRPQNRQRLRHREGVLSIHRQAPVDGRQRADAERAEDVPLQGAEPSLARQDRRDREGLREVHELDDGEPGRRIEGRAAGGGVAELGEGRDRVAGHARHELAALQLAGGLPRSACADRQVGAGHRVRDLLARGQLPPGDADRGRRGGRRCLVARGRDAVVERLGPALAAHHVAHADVPRRQKERRRPTLRRGPRGVDDYPKNR
mmetsp:Transcript_4405/g.12467  ORF Transcript_4405/g.12467 Transcript_4405/m.12467 type:complete len:302 (-) Transcript_4405:587-1492(-)